MARWLLLDGHKPDNDGADIALHTKTLKVGQSPTSICDWHPIRVAEDIATLDHMTLGRAEFGIGRGFNSRWGAQLNPEADRRNNEKNYALFTESLDIIIKAWTEEAFSHKGRFYTIPYRAGWRPIPVFLLLLRTTHRRGSWLRCPFCRSRTRNHIHRSPRW